MNKESLVFTLAALTASNNNISRAQLMKTLSKKSQ